MRKALSSDGSILILAAVLFILLAGCEAATSSDDDGISAVADVASLKAGLADGAVTLSWTDPADPDFASVEISGNGFSSRTVPKGAGTAVISGLTSGTAYTFLVRSVDTGGNKNSGTSIRATPFGDVSGVYALTFSGGVVLRYGNPKASGFSKVEISGTGFSPITVSPDSVNWGQTTVSGLMNGDTHTVTVKVMDADGNKQTSGSSVGAVPGMCLALSEGTNTPLDTYNQMSGSETSFFALVGGSAVSASWTSSDESVATVDGNGLVTGVAPGVARITAEYGQYTSMFGFAVWDVGVGNASFSMNVEDPDPIFSYDKAYSYILIPNINDAGGFPVTAAAKKSSGTLKGYYGFEIRPSSSTNNLRFRFEIRPQGQYRIRKKTNDATTVLVDWTSSSAILAGLNQENAVTVDWSTGQLNFSVNSEYLRTVSDPDNLDFSGGWINGRVGLDTIFNVDYSASGAETVEFLFAEPAV